MLETTIKRYLTSKDREDTLMRQEEGHNHNKIKPHTWWVADPQTEGQLYQRSSSTAVKVLSPKSDFQSWGSGKDTWIPRGIWPWKPAGFDHRTSTGLGKQSLLSGRAPAWSCLHQDQRKGVVTPQETESNLPANVGLLWRHGSAVASCRIEHW